MMKCKARVHKACTSGHVRGHMQRKAKFKLYFSSAVFPIRYGQRSIDDVVSKVKDGFSFLSKSPASAATPTPATSPAPTPAKAAAPAKAPVKAADQVPAAQWISE